jgi:hypothetical protein
MLFNVHFKEHAAADFTENLSVDWMLFVIMLQQAEGK